jgi:hypothetical protein
VEYAGGARASGSGGGGADDEAAAASHDAPTHYYASKRPVCVFTGRVLGMHLAPTYEDECAARARREHAVVAQPRVRAHRGPPTQSNVVLGVATNPVARRNPELLKTIDDALARCTGLSLATGDEIRDFTLRTWRALMEFACKPHALASNLVGAHFLTQYTLSIHLIACVFAMREGEGSADAFIQTPPCFELPLILPPSVDRVRLLLFPVKPPALDRVVRAYAQLLTRLAAVYRVVELPLR